MKPERIIRNEVALCEDCGRTTIWWKAMKHPYGPRCLACLSPRVSRCIEEDRK